MSLCCQDSQRLGLVPRTCLLNFLVKFSMNNLCLLFLYPCNLETNLLGYRIVRTCDDCCIVQTNEHRDQAGVTCIAKQTLLYCHIKTKVYTFNHCLLTYTP